jgi:hypothetical protein
MKNIILTLAFALAFLGCERTNAENAFNPQLPPVTTVGANTFGCKINGVVMVPRNSIGYVAPGFNHYACGYRRGQNYEYEGLGGSDLRETNRGGVSIYFQNINNLPAHLGVHNIHDGVIPSENNQNYKDYIYVAYQNKSYVSISGTGHIEVLKSDDQIISGTFSCKAINIDNINDVIDISGGRFDFNKTTINTTNFP